MTILFNDIRPLLNIPYHICITKHIYNQMNNELSLYTMPFAEFSEIHPDLMYHTSNKTFMVLTDSIFNNIQYLSNDKFNLDYFKNFIVNSIEKDDKFGILVTLLEDY